MSYLSSLFGLFGGLGMFLYGMTIMSDGMQKAASSKMSKFLNIVTENRIMAVLLGAGITALVQSSSATTVMVVGFVNAGILNLSQSVGIIMGANIGTTITAWMVSLTQVSSSALSLFKPEFFAPLLVGFGAFRFLFGKKGNDDLLANFCIGVGLIFIGLEFMSSAVSPYADSPIFSKAFQLMGGNPVLGILAGAVVTGLIQSSAASVSILQTLALSGAVPRTAGFYITLGQNIGSCVTAIISSMGSSRTAKRAAAIHFLFNTIGAIVFGILGFVVFSINKNLANHTINAVEISLFHTLFNFTMTTLLFPFANLLVKLSGMIVRGKDEEVVEEEKEPVLQLDERVLLSPAFAVQTANNEVARMGEIALKSLNAAMSAINNKSLEDIETVAKCEKKLDDMQEALMEFLIKVDNLSLSENQKKHVNNLFNMVTDIERVGDHADNLSENAKYMIDNDLEFSDLGKEDLAEISKDSIEAFETALNARRGDALRAVRKVNKLEDEVDMLEDEMREKHIERLSKGDCNPQAGIAFLDIISNLERISDHATNIAGYVKNEI